MRRKARLRLQAMGSPGKHLSRGVTWSDTGLSRVHLASRSTAAKCPPSPPSRHLKVTVVHQPPQTPGPLWPGPLPAMLQGPAPGSAYSCLHSSPPSTPHSKVLPSTFQEAGLLQARPQGQALTLACPQAQGRPIPRPSRCALFSEHCPLLSRLQAPPSNRLTWSQRLREEPSLTARHSLQDT